MLIKTTKDGRKVELIGEKIYLGGEYHADGIYPLIPMQMGKAREVLPDAAYVSGKILLNKEQGDRALAEIRASQRARWDAQEAKINQAVPGIDILRAAYNADEDYRQSFEKMMEDENNDGARPPSRPATNSADLAKKYPRAAAYLKAEAYSGAAHDCKASAGRKAMELLASGGSIEDAEKILANWLPESAAWN